MTLNKSAFLYTQALVDPWPDFDLVGGACTVG